MTTLNEDNNNNGVYDKFNNSDTQIKLYNNIAILVKYTLIDNSDNFLLHHSFEDRKSLKSR